MDEPNDQPANSQASETPCPICKQQSYCWGRTVIETSDWLYFRQQGGMWGDGERLQARKCLNCGNVQLFAQP